jgi:outer membrane receptor protein involved in Fe transport
MNTAGLVVALLSIATATTVTTDGVVPPKPSAPAVAPPRAASADQLPLLFIVDGVRYAGDQVPLLSPEIVASVKVIKGHRALQQYGPDASYGVVVITTKLAAAHGS